MSETARRKPLGTRALLSLGAVLMGLLVGSVTTVVHQNVVTIAGVQIPWGLVFSLVAVTGFLVGLRIVVQDRLVVLCAAVGIVGMVFLLSQRSVGGSVLIPDNLWGSIWAIAPTLIATVVVAWPKLPDRRRGASATAVSS